MGTYIHSSLVPIHSSPGYKTHLATCSYSLGICNAAVNAGDPATVAPANILGQQVRVMTGFLVWGRITIRLGLGLGLHLMLAFITGATVAGANVLNSTVNLYVCLVNVLHCLLAYT